MNWRTLFFPAPRLLIQRFAILVAALPIIGWIGGGYWLCDLCNHLQFQYAAFLLLSAVLLLVMKAFREAAVVAVLALIPVVRILPCYVPPAEVTSTGKTMRIASFNVLVSNHRYADALAWVRKTNPDFIYFTETTDAWVEALKPLSDTYPHSIEEGTGFVFYSKFPITQHEIVRCSEYRFPLLVAHVASPNGEVAIFGIHPLPPVSARWSRALDESMAILAREVDQETGPIIVAGDFNITRWSHMARPLDCVGLLDASRGKSPGATWNRNNLLVTIPIDRILFRGQRMDCRSFTIGEDLGSDHRPVVAEMAW